MGSVVTTHKQTKKETELFAAIYKQDFIRAKQLIESGVSVDCLNIYGASPLIETCRTISEEEQNGLRENFVEYLLMKGCDTSKEDVFETTAYLYAVEQHHDKITELLEHRHIWNSLFKGKGKNKRRISINDYLTLYNISEDEEDQ